MNRRIFAMILLTGTIAAGAGLGTRVSADPVPDARVYVRSQDRFYDTIILTELPPHGQFQLLEMGPNGLETDFGPGDPGYLGGRWAEDFNGDGVYGFFLCPLIP